MIFKWVLFSFLCCFLINPSYAQQQQAYKAIKLYATYHHWYNKLRLTPAFTIRGKRKHFHEVGVNQVYRKGWEAQSVYNYQVYTSEFTQSKVALYYQLGYPWYQQQRFIAYIAGSIGLEGYAFSTNPQHTNLYKRKVKSGEVFLGVVPGVRFTFSDHWVADINSLVDIYMLGWYYQRHYYPYILPRQQKSLSKDQTWIPLGFLRIRVGIAYRW